MNETKKNRIAAATTVAVILLIAILAVVLICQVAKIVTQKKEKERLQEQIRAYQELIDDKEDELKYLKSWPYLEHMLSWYGYHPPKN